MLVVSSPAVHAELLALAQHGNLPQQLLDQASPGTATTLRVLGSPCRPCRPLETVHFWLHAAPVCKVETD